MGESTRVAAREGQAADDDLSMTDVLRVVVGAIDRKKGADPIILDLSDHLDYLDYIVVCSGETELHTQAIADQVVADLARYDIIPDGINGYRYGDWVLVDYGVLVVHVFLPALRDFYRLEELWGAGRAVELN
jgi:ribosome-associated protein